MVATMNNGFFERSKEFFEKGDLTNALEYYEKAIPYIDKTKEKSIHIQFLNQLLEYCKKNKLVEEQAIVFRCLGRTYSLFKNYVESLKYHQESLKIQRKLGKNKEIAESLVYLAEDFEVSGKYDECINAFQNASEIFHELGNLRKSKEIEKEIKRLKEFSKEIFEAEYLINKFHINRD